MCKISVIIPVYNTSLYLKQCLDSVLGQSFTEFEVICLDDCSTDDSLKILYEYSKSDDRVLVLKNEEKKGPGITRNRGLETASGEYIYFLDSDDYIVPNALEVMRDKAEEHNADVVLFNAFIDAREVGLKSSSLNWNLEKKQFDTIMTGQEAFINIVEKNTWSSSVWRQFWRKSFLQNNKIEFENKTSAEDWIFTTTSLLIAQRVVFIDATLHTYVWHEQSLTTSHHADKIKNAALNYISMLAFWMSHTFPQKTNYSIKKHMDRQAEHIRTMHVQYADVFSIEMFEDLMHQHLYQLVTNTNRPFILERKLDKDFIDKLNNFELVYIYGASDYAIQMYEQLLKWDVNVQGFVVTGFSRAKSIYGLSVFKLEDICMDSDSVVFVLGVTSKNRKDIIENLERHGFHNYLSLQV